MKFDNIFVVDDDKIFHFIFKKLLATNSININPAFFENGYLALEGLKMRVQNGETEPDLILLDINMPVLDGWQFLEEYRKLKVKIKKDITIYIVSSSDNQVDMDKAKSYQSEVKDYYLKPITADDLKNIFQLKSISV